MSSASGLRFLSLSSLLYLIFLKADYFIVSSSWPLYNVARLKETFFLWNNVSSVRMAEFIQWEVKRLFTDYHVHTEFSDDSVYPMESVVQDAIQMGMG